MKTLATAQGAGRSLFDFPTAALRSLTAAISDRWTRFKTYRQLARLDDRLLADMGLTRMEVEAWYRG